MDFDKTMNFQVEREENTKANDNSRYKIRTIERDELFEKMVKNYIGIGLED